VPEAARGALYRSIGGAGKRRRDTTMKGYLEDFYFEKQFINQIIFPDFLDFQKKLISRNIEFFASLKEKHQQKVCVVIPAKNEEAGIHETIELSKAYADRIIVIDGHSTDRTREIAEQSGVEVFLDDGKGKGSAIRQAISLVNEDIIVFIDADGSHNPHDIPRLVIPIIRGEYDHVGGSRTRGGSDELHGDLEKFLRMIGSDIITLSINYRFGVRLTDSQNGFRAIRTTVAKDLDLRENITTIEQEMIMKSLRKRYRVGEVPTFEHARKGGRSKIILRKVWFRYVYSMIKYLLV